MVKFHHHHRHLQSSLPKMTLLPKLTVATIIKRLLFNNHKNNDNYSIKHCSTLPKMIIILILIISITFITNVQANSSSNNEPIAQSESISKSTFQLRPKDGVQNGEGKSYPATINSSTTTAKDIRKLLEDYVQYLANLPDIRKEIREKNSHSNSKKSQQDIISTAETSDEKAIHPRLTAYQTFVPITNHPSSQGEYVYHHDLNEDDDDDDMNDERRQRLRNNFGESNVVAKQQSSSTKPQRQSNTDQNSIIIPTNRYADKSSVTLGLNDEELSSFIKTVLGTVKTKNEPTTTTTELPLALIDEQDDEQMMSNMTNINDGTYNNDLAIEELMAYVDPEDDDNDDDDDNNNNNNDDDNGKIANNLIEHQQNSSMNETFLETSTIQPLMMETTTFDPLLSEMIVTNETNNISGEKSVFNLNNVVVDDDDLSTTTMKSIIENRINLTKITDEFYHKENKANDSNQQQPHMSEINQNDLLEQLKRTRELLSIQIEKLKTLEQTVFQRRKTTAETATTITATTVPMITTESPLDMTTESNLNHLNEHQDNQIDQPSIGGTYIFDKNLLNNETSHEMLTTSAPEYSSSSLRNIEMTSLNIDKNITAKAVATTIQPNDDNGSYYETTTAIQIPTYKHNNNNKEKSFRFNLIKENGNNNNNNDEIIYSKNSPHSSKSIQPNDDIIEKNNINRNNVKIVKSSNKDQNKIRINVNPAVSIFKNNQAKQTESDSIIKLNDSNYDRSILSLKTTAKPLLMPIIQQNNRLTSSIGNDVSKIVIPIINSSMIEPLKSPSSLFAMDEPNSVLILSHSNGGEEESTNNNNNNNVNIKNNESNIETMILTHVPKITIIHKIMKPIRTINGNKNNNVIKIDRQNIKDQSIDNIDNQNNNNKNRDYLFESDENIYQEALRRHQDLIRSTMSSMSLYPASIKRYRIKNGPGNNSRINSVGEIYLLPNFSTTNKSQQKQQQQTNFTTSFVNKNNQSKLIDVPISLANDSLLLSKQIHTINNDYSNTHYSLVSESKETSVGSSKTMNNSNNNNEKIIDTNKNLIDNNKQVENNNNINNNNNSDHIMIPRNKFNNPNVFQLNNKQSDEENDDHQKNPQNQQSSSSLINKNEKNQSKKRRTKLSSNTQTMMTINRHPENLLRLYRPRFKHRKRFRKIRLPNGHRFIRKDNNTLATTTTIIDTDDSVSNQLSATTTIRPSSSTIDDISDFDIKKVENNEILRQTTTILPEIETLDLINSTQNDNDSEISIMTTTMEPTINELITDRPDEIIRTTTNNSSINIIPAEVLINSTINNRLMNQTNNFKIFCTYDAYRSIPFAENDNDNNNSSNNDKGRYFDIDQLEKNSVFLKYCTHLIYAFANIDLNGELYTGLNTMHQDSLVRDRNREYNEAFLVRFRKLKQNNPHLRLLIAVGGWDTPPQLFSLMVATGKLRERLSENIYKFVFENGFDGAIIAWFYPVYGSKSSMDSRSTRATSHSMFQFNDKQNLIKFVRSLRKKFDSISRKNRLELGLMVPPFQDFIDRGYDAKKLAESVDHLILMTYDYYGSWENHVHHFSPLYAQNSSFDERNVKFNINSTVNYWIKEKQAPRNQTMIGFAFYGRSFTLANHSNGKIGSLSNGPGLAGPITNRPGLLSFNELCELYLGNPNVRLSEDEYRITANLQLHDQWVGFDDELSLYLKTKYALGNHLSGIFIWSINYDDYRNRCGWGQFPLLKAVNKAVEHCALWKQCSPYMIRDHHHQSQIAQNSSSLPVTTRRRKR